MPTIKKSKSTTAREIPFKHAWGRLPSIEIDRDSAIIDLAYLFAGLVAITQSRLVHRILQGVEHTDPTEWSNSHRSIGDKFMMAVWRIVSLFKSCSNDNLILHMVTALQHLHFLKALNPS